MDFWIILYFVDWILFIAVTGTVIYLGVFSVASLFSRETIQNKANVQPKRNLPKNPSKLMDRFGGDLTSMVSPTKPIVVPETQNDLKQEVVIPDEIDGVPSESFVNCKGKMLDDGTIIMQAIDLLRFSH